MKNDETKINKAIKDACIRSKCIICNKQFDNNDLYRGNFCASQSGEQWRFGGTMNRGKVTKALSDLLVRDVLHKKYWADEVTFNYGRNGECRIDFMTFAPVNQSTSGIEKGSFTAYEVKSCLPDFRSKNGHNMFLDKNYYVMPMELYKSVVNELPYNVGVYCPVPSDKDKLTEFENPTKAEELTLDKCRLICIRNSHPKDRDVSGSVALFCMMRSGCSNLTKSKGKNMDIDTALKYMTIAKAIELEQERLFCNADETINTIAIHCMKKQIPSNIGEIYQAIIEDMPGKCILSGNCPVCGSPVPKKHWYCWSCGQRLKWPENQHMKPQREEKI